METVEAWEARTGARYLPPRAVRAEGAVLQPTDTCPVLYRYPGPCGLRDAFSGSLAHLAPATSPLLWLSEQPLHADVPGAALFGTLVLRDPLHVSPVRSARPGIWVGRNLATRRVPGVEWLAPSRLTDARGSRGTLAEREAVAASVMAYLEELACLQETAGPGVSWCRVSRGERERRLREAGVTPTWTGRHDEACSAA